MGREELRFTRAKGQRWEQVGYTEGIERRGVLEPRRLVR